MADDTFGFTLRSLRIKAGMSQEELAAKAQVSRASVQNWEKNRRQPRNAEARRLSRALGVEDLRTLTGRQVEPQEIREALEAALKLEDPEEMREALLDLLSHIPPEEEH